jgi:hypothetical protein
MKIFKLLPLFLLLSCKPKIIYIKQDIQGLKQCFISVERPKFDKINEFNLELVAKHIKDLRGYIQDLELKTKSEQECMFKVLE